MSRDHKHIDRIFQENFKHFEAQPNAKIWNEIEAKIHPKKRRIFPIWLKFTGAAAALILAFGLGYWSKLSTPTQIESFSNLSTSSFDFKLSLDKSTSLTKANDLLNSLIDKSQDFSASNNFIQNSIVQNTNTTPTNNDLASVYKTENPVTKLDKFSAIVNRLYVETSLLKAFNFSENTSILNTKTIQNKITETATISADETGKTQFDSLFEDESLVVDKETSIAKKWFLKPVISPIFNAGQNASSAIGQDLASNESTGDVSFSYGMQVGFKVNNKWSIRTGVNQVNTSYTTQNVVYAPSAGAFISSNVVSTYGVYNQNYYDNNIGNQGTRIFSENGNLTQQLGFIEVPLEIEYTILDGKFGVNLSGGASTFLLTNNGLLLDTADGMMNIGESQNINQTSFSTNIGLGLNYAISQKLQLNVEPAFKYQLNTFQGSNLSFNPYFFGVYTGLQFQF